MAEVTCGIWLLDVREAGTEWIERSVRWMGAGERDRSAGFVRPERRHQFVLARALLRQAVASEAACAPEDVEVLGDAGDPPRVAIPEGGTRWCSISHSRDLIACAVATQGPIGLDIELRSHERDATRLSAVTFSSDEQSWISRAPDPARAFYDLWTAREAAVKVRSQLARAGADQAMRFSIADGALVPPPGVAILYHLDATENYAMCLASAVVMPRPLVRLATTLPE
jgi:4'-phosphopantetheinyl transferase